MQLLDYLRLAQEYEKKGLPKKKTGIRIAIVTNFTDDILKKALVGLCVSEGIRPEIYQVPFKQYLFEFKDAKSSLKKHASDITFVFFDVNPYITSEFLVDKNHVESVCNDIAAFCRKNKGTFVLHTLTTPSLTQHGRLLKENKLSNLVHDFNKRIRDMAEELNNVFVLDTNHLVQGVGEHKARDLRGLYAFSQPFSNEFFLRVAKEWAAYVRTLSGMVRKCLVVDLDNVLWGGIVGEVGPLGISLGHEYPGNAYVAFQQALLQYYEEGIILAINSRNNTADVDEVFAKNPHMVLKKSHFASIMVNWKTKAENISAIGKELNIGLDSMVFLDDDPLNRELVRTQHPEVLVPEFSLPPEEYTKTLLDLDAFHSFNQTLEDKERGVMYAKERERREAVASAPNAEDYLKTLDVQIDISINNKHLIPRLAQLTQKTNQFNLTTHRLTEKEVEGMIKSGTLVFAGDVRDKFGPYGVTILAIIEPKTKKEATLHTFLMSCRVMGRGVEEEFFRYIAKELSSRGYEKLAASFIETKKNVPIKDFLPNLKAVKALGKKKGVATFEVPLKKYLTATDKVISPVKVKKITS